MALIFGLGSMRVRMMLGALVGLDYTAVSRERKRLRDRIESDKALKKRLIEIEVSVLSSVI